jgi:hypothetical protein
MSEIMASSDFLRYSWRNLLTHGPLRFTGEAIARWDNPEAYSLTISCLTGMAAVTCFGLRRGLLISSTPLGGLRSDVSRTT